MGHRRLIAITNNHKLSHKHLLRLIGGAAPARVESEIDRRRDRFIRKRFGNSIYKLFPLLALTLRWLVGAQYDEAVQLIVSIRDWSV